MTLTRTLCVLAAAAFFTATVSAGTMTAAARVSVPFEFVVAGKTMPAGTYTISSPEASGLLSIRGDRNNSVLTVGTPVSSPASKALPQLVFVRKNGKLHLTQILSHSAMGGSELPVR